MTMGGGITVSGVAATGEFVWFPFGMVIKAHEVDVGAQMTISLRLQSILLTMSFR
jgi:hypothetical protein